MHIQKQVSGIRVRQFPRIRRLIYDNIRNDILYIIHPELLNHVSLSTHKSPDISDIVSDNSIVNH